MRTDEKLQELCERLHYNCGDIHEAARYCLVSPAFVMSWIKDDKTAASKIEEARRVGYAGLESEAIRRAVHGIEKSVYYKGVVVGTEQVYSDGLLTKLMEARLPEYNKKEGGGNNFLGPTQINIMPRANTYEEWLQMKDATLARRELPAPDSAVDAEYTVLPTLDKPLAALEGIL